MDVSALLSVARRRWWVVAILVVAGYVGGFSYGHAQTPVYRATSTSYVNLPLGSGTNLDGNLASVQISASYVQTYAQVITSREIAERVIKLTNVPYSAGQVQGSLSAAAVSGTFLIKITARDVDPNRAAAIATAAAQALHDASLSVLQPSSDAKVTATTIDNATPPRAPISPKPKTSEFLGIVLGLLVGLAITVLLELLDRSVKTTRQAEDLTASPVLGTVPRRRGGLSAGTQDSPHDIASEAYRALRTAVRFLDPDTPLRTILVTSPSPGDGKTTTAANLAVAYARGGERVVVVDGDLRRATLATFFGLEPAVGVTSILRRQVALRDALQSWSPNLRVLPSGPLPPNPAEVLGSQAMANLLEQLADQADVVIIDGPPVLPVTDAVALATQVDGVVVVARHGKTSRTALAEAVRRLAAVGAPVAGVVLNGQPPAEAREYYVDYLYQEVAVPRTAPRPDGTGDAEGGAGPSPDARGDERVTTRR